MSILDHDSKSADRRYSVAVAIEPWFYARVGSAFLILRDISTTWKRARAQIILVDMEKNPEDNLNYDHAYVTLLSQRCYLGTYGS